MSFIKWLGSLILVYGIINLLLHPIINTTKRNKNEEKFPPFSYKEGWIYPLIFRFFALLKQISVLTHIKRKREWETSRTVVDCYVFSWFLIAITFFLGIGLYQLNEPNPTHIIVKIGFGFMFYRLIDIFQAWSNTLLISPTGAKWPRLAILTFMNYIEIAIAFSLIGFLFKALPYYDIGKGEITVWDSLRHSLYILTPLGVSEPDLPSRLSGFTIFWIEYMIGLLFLILIINLVIAHYKTNDT